MLENYYFVYIITNEKRGTLYIGVTNNIVRRIYEHKEHFVDSFSKSHSLKKLVYYEVFNDINEAITREKVLKKWNRIWKIKLIEDKNPNWDDLYYKL